MRIAAFGIRSIPPANGSAGSDTFAHELYTRLAGRGHEVTAYCRTYKNVPSPVSKIYRNVKLVHLKTVSASGFDTLLHSCLATFHIIFRNTGDVVHIHNGGNSMWALPLRLWGKRVIVSQDGIDWKRDKWNWYARLFLRFSAYVTAYLPSRVVFDNIFARDIFQDLFHRSFPVIPFGSDFQEPANLDVLDRFGLSKGGYFLFIGRFIPDKGIHYLIEAFEQIRTDKMLVIVGGSPNPGSDYEKRIRATRDPRVRFVGYVYGDESLQLMKGCYCYVQPSDVEGLSPVLLTALGSGSPVICSDIPENRYAVGETALVFTKSSVSSLREMLEQSLFHPGEMMALAEQARLRARRMFSWSRITDSYEAVFSGTETAGEEPR